MISDVHFCSPQVDDAEMHTSDSVWPSYQTERHTLRTCPVYEYIPSSSGSSQFSGVIQLQYQSNCLALADPLIMTLFSIDNTN